MKKNISNLARKIIICSMVLTMPIATVACTKKENSAAKNVSTNQDKKGKAEENKVNYNEKIAKLYNETLDKSESFNFEDDNQNAMEYKYSLVKMDGSDIPQLLISKKTEFRDLNIKVFSYDKDSNKIIEAKPVIYMGNSSGSLRTNLQVRKDNSSLELASTSSGSGDSMLETIRIEKGSVIKKTEWEGKFAQMPSSETIEIEWSDLTDRSQIDKLLARTSDDENVKNNSTTNDSSVDKQIKAEKAAGNIILRGKFYVFNRAQMLRFQGIEDPNPEVAYPDEDEPYCIIGLDSPQKLTFHSSGGPYDYTGLVKILNISNRRDYDMYNGKNVVVSIKPGDGTWPSDTSLPLGQPSVNIKILGAYGSKSQVKNTPVDSKSADKIKNTDQVIRAKNTNMRADHSKNSAIVKTLLSGTRVHVSDTYVESADRIWCKVTYDGVTGWVSYNTMNGKIK